MQKKRTLKKKLYKKSYKILDYKKKGGSIFVNNEFEKIISIGYEFECGDLMVTNLSMPSEDNPRQNRKQFRIPTVHEQDEYLTDKSCNTVGNYTCILSTETDTPLSGANETHSKMYDFEQKYLDQEKAGVDINDNTVISFLENANFDVYSNNLESIFFTHAEILFTIFDKKNSCQNANQGIVSHYLKDDKCILNTMKTMIDILFTYFIPGKFTNGSNEYAESDMKLSFFTPNPLWVSKPIYYVVPTVNNHSTVLDIYNETRWVPQMTYCVKVDDIISVTEQLSKLLEKDDLEQIAKSMDILDTLMAPAYYEDLPSSKTKKKTKVPKPTKTFKEVREKIKNVLFFAVYYFYTYYFFDSVMGVVITSIKNPKLGKNIFCFTIRHSIYELLNHYMKKYPEEMNKLNELLSKNLIENDNNISDTVAMAIPNLISYVSRSFCRIFSPTYAYVPENHTYPPTTRGSKDCETDINMQNDDDYIFSKILKCQSNYFDFDRENETVLIEYRCFHKNIIQSYNFKFPKSQTTSSIHKSLNEWKNIIDSLHILRK
jgi:hypothetical protein